jgi:hypothetical protein
MLNKYIREKYIILLIEEYASFGIAEIYNKFECIIDKKNWIKNKPECYKNKTINLLHNFNLNIVIYILAKNAFVIFDPSDKFELLKTKFELLNSLSHFYETKFNKINRKQYTQILKDSNSHFYETKFNKINKKQYTQILKDSNKLSHSEFKQTYERLFETIKPFNKTRSLVNMYDIKLYNIKLLGEQQNEDYTANICDDIFISDIQNIFPKIMMQNIIINHVKSPHGIECISSIEINMSNLKNE